MSKQIFEAGEKISHIPRENSSVPARVAEIPGRAPGSPKQQLEAAKVINKFITRQTHSDPEVTLRRLAGLQFIKKRYEERGNSQKSQHIHKAKKFVPFDYYPSQRVLENDYPRYSKTDRLSLRRQEVLRSKKLIALEERNNHDKKVTTEKLLREQLNEVKDQLGISQHRYHELSLALANAFAANRKGEEKDWRPLSLFEFLLFMGLFFMKALADEEAEKRR